MPPYHPDYEPPPDGDDDDDDVDDDDDGERYAEYERAHTRVRRGSEGYEVRAIDREGLLAEYIASRAQEEGHYRRYVPEPPSEPDSSESGWEEEDGEKGDVGVVVEREDVVVDDEDEPLAVRVERWRSGEAIA